MNKKICVVALVLIMLSMVAGVVFAQSHDYCPAHARQNARGEFVNDCQTCRTAKVKYDRRQAARAENERRLRDQRRLLAQKEQEKAAAETVAEANQIEQEIRSVRITIVQIEAELD
jgi:cell division protein FtsN